MSYYTKSPGRAKKHVPTSNCQRFIDEYEAEDEIDFAREDEPTPDEFDTLAEYCAASQDYAFKKYVPGWHERQQKLAEEEKAASRKQKSDAIRAECSRPELAAGIYAPTWAPRWKIEEAISIIPMPIKDEIWEHF
jgi:hypothetical protein